MLDAIMEHVVALTQRLQVPNATVAEHDLGRIELASLSIFFKIDYHDSTKQCHSPDAAERVMTIMRADEY